MPEFDGVKSAPSNLIFLTILAFLARSEAGEEIRSAISKALPVIEAGARGSAEERRCFTCHHQGLPILAAVEARKHGFAIDEVNLQRQVDHTVAHLKRGQSNYKKGIGQGGKADTAGMALWSLEAVERPPDEVTNDVVHFLLTWNATTPHWRPQSDRPPSEGSLFTSTYLAVRALEAYGGEAHRASIRTRRAAALKWLTQTEPEETEDAVFRLRSLYLFEVEIEAAAKQLLDLQGADGGWSQLPDLPSEAYSTGSALAALHESGALRAGSEEYRRGVRFLLESQSDDGSWHVTSRSRPIQEPYETGFPYGKDQFISSSGTCWAVLALLQALEEP